MLSLVRKETHVHTHTHMLMCVFVFQSYRCFISALP